MKARRRALAAIVTLAIGGALAAPLLIVSAANADDGLELTSPTGSGTYSGAEYTFSGTADPADTTPIVIRDGAGAADPVLCTTAASASWSCDGDWVPTAGAHTLSAWQDTRHDTVTFTLDVPAPIVDDLTITIVEGGTVHVSGTTTAPNSDIIITIDGSNYCGGGSTYPNGFAWWCDLGGWMGTGTFSLSVRQEVNGVSSAPVGGGTLTVLTPGFHLNSPTSAERIVWIPDPTFTPSGLTDDLVTPIDVSIDGTVPGVCDDILPAPDGSWSCSLAHPRPNEPASHTILATQGANSASVTFEMTYPAPDWLGGAVVNAVVGDTATSFSGTALYNDGGPLGESVHVSVDGTGLYCNSPLSVVNTFQCDIDTSSLAVGSYVTQAYEAYGPISGDAVSGTLNILAAGSTDPVTLTSPTAGATVTGSTLFTGTGPIGGDVEVLVERIGTAIPEQSACTATVAPDGSWSCTMPGTMYGLWDARAEGTDVLSGVTTTPTQTLRVAGYPKPTLSYAGSTNGIYAHGISGDGGDVSIWLYQVDTSDPTQYTWVGPVSNCPLAVPIQIGCTLNSGAPLAPGIWNVFAEDVWMNVALPGESVRSTRDVYFYVPATPTLTPTVNPNRTVTFAVTREAGSTVTVTDVDTSAVACTVSGAGTGGTCVTTPTAGTHQYSAQAVSVGFHSNTGTPRVADNDYDWYSAVATSAPVVVPPAPAPNPEPEPEPEPAPSPTKTPWSWSFTYTGPAELHPGDQVQFTGQGVPAQTTIDVELHSTPMKLGAITAEDDGTFAFTTTIPDDVEPGDHHFVLTATAPGEEPSTLEEAVAIYALPEEPVDEEVDPEEEPTDETDGSGSGSGGGERSNPAAPSALTDSIATLEDVFFHDPRSLMVAGILGIALLFLVAIPTELLNSTLSSNHSRLGRGFRAIERTSNRITEWFIRVTRSRALAAAIIVILVSIIFGFVDPNFGFDLTSLRLVLSLSIAFFILSFVASWITGAIVRRTSGTESEIVIQPAIILFAILGVVVARALEFTPGFLVGLVIGLELVRASRRAAASAVLIQFGIVLGISIAAWVGYSLMTAQGAPDDFFGALLIDTQVALVAEGLMAILVAALPLRFLEGHDLWSQSKALWLSTYFVIAFAFALLVLPTALETTDAEDVGLWVLVFFGFGVVTLLLWAVFSWLDRRDARAEGDGDGETERNTPQHEETRR